MKGKKVIVTGGAGFIGSHVCDLLIENDYPVVVVDNLSTGKKENINKKAEFVKLDITKVKEVVKLFSNIKPICVFHLAAWPRIVRSVDDPIGTHNVNVGGTLSVLEGAKAIGARLVHSSSSSVYGKQKTHVLKENMQPRPISHYALQKYLAEQYLNFYAEKDAMEIVSLRYFNVFGKRQPSKGIYALVLGKFLEQIRKGQKLTVYGDGKQTRDFTFVGDVARANLLALSARIPKGKNTILNIGSSKETSVNEIVGLLGAKAEHVYPNPRGEYEERRKVADISLAKKVLGWEPKVTLAQAVKIALF